MLSVVTLYTSYVLMMLSNRLYRSLRRVTTCSGELKEHNLVKPTMSEKKMVTESKLSGSTDLPATSCSLMKLEQQRGKRHLYFRRRITVDP